MNGLQLKYLVREQVNLKKVRHPYVVRYYGHKVYDGQLELYMELVGELDLREFINQQSK